MIYIQQFWFISVRHFLYSIVPAPNQVIGIGCSRFGSHHSMPLYFHRISRVSAIDFTNNARRINALPCRAACTTIRSMESLLCRHNFQFRLSVAAAAFIRACMRMFTVQFTVCRKFVISTLTFQQNRIKYANIVVQLPSPIRFRDAVTTKQVCTLICISICYCECVCYITEARDSLSPLNSFRIYVVKLVQNAFRTCFQKQHVCDGMVVRTCRISFEAFNSNTRKKFSQNSLVEWCASF